LGIIFKQTNKSPPPLVQSQAISKLVERCENSEAQSLFSVVNDLSKVFGKRIKEEQLLGFLYPLLEGLLDAQTDSADGCCVVVNGIFRQRGAELVNEVPALIEAMHHKVWLLALACSSWSYPSSYSPPLPL
jgi:hypothetical protein